LLKVGGKMMVDGYNMGLALKSNKDAQAAFMANIAKLPLPDGLTIYKKWLPKLNEAQQAEVLEHILTADASSDIGFIAKLLKSKSADVQFRVAVALGHRGNAAGKTLLIEALGAGDDERTLKALRALRTIGGKSEFPLLKAIVNNEASPAPLVEAAYAVYAHNKYGKLSGHLRNRIAKSNQLSHRAAAVRVLGMVEGRSALNILHGRLGDGAPIVRRYAAMAVGDVAQPMSLKPLGDALNRETNPDVQRALIAAVGRIRAPEGAKFLTRFIYDNDIETRRVVVEALVAMRHAKTVPLLKQFLMNERNDEIRRAALLGMLMLGPKKHLKTFRDAVGWLGAAELEPLVSTHKAEMMPHLKVALNASRADLRNAALDAASHLSKKQQAELYGIASLQSPHNKFKVRALEKLVALQGKKCRDVLVALVKDKSLRVRVAAIRHFGALKDKSAATMLIGLLDARKEVVRVAAAGALLGL
jgi:HEAT repeat protein